VGDGSHSPRLGATHVPQEQRLPFRLWKGELLLQFLKEWVAQDGDLASLVLHHTAVCGDVLGAALQTGLECTLNIGLCPHPAHIPEGTGALCTSLTNSLDSLSSGMNTVSRKR